MNTYSHLLDPTNEIIHSAIIFVAPLAFIFIMTFLVSWNVKDDIPENVPVAESEVEEETSDEEDEEDEDDESYEDDSDDDEITDDSEKYSSVVQKAFTLLTKKQLISITGKKYKNKNKDELVVIALYKFMLSAVKKSDKLPKGIKHFVEANKDVLKSELLELYEIDA